MMGFAKDLQDAADHSPAVPKAGFFTAPVTYTDIAGKTASCPFNTGLFPILHNLFCDAECLREKVPPLTGGKKTLIC